MVDDENYDPRTYHIAQDAEGFYLASEDGEDQTPIQRWQSPAEARLAQKQMVECWLSDTALYMPVIKW